MPDQTRVRITLSWPRQRTVSRAKSLCKGGYTVPGQTRVRITLPWPRQRKVSRAKSSNVKEA